MAVLCVRCRRQKKDTFTFMLLVEGGWTISMAFELLVLLCVILPSIARSACLFELLIIFHTTINERSESTMTNFGVGVLIVEGLGI